MGGGQTLICLMEYCDYKYEADGNGYYSIIPNKTVPRPETFFKYYALTDYSVDALTNMYIYATHPNQFNDPFDCNEKLIVFDSLEDIQKLWDVPQLYEEYIQLYPSVVEACRQCSHDFKTVLFRKLGLFSLAPKPDNYLMWALYSQNKGFCVEFDVKEFPFRHFGPYPINYVEEISHPIHIGETGGPIAMLIQSNIKNSWWQYENEWRLYIPNPEGLDMKSFGPESERFNSLVDHDRRFKYQLSALCSVTLGNAFFEDLTIYSISQFEIEVESLINDNSKQMRVLDFLSEVQSKTDLNVYITSLYDFSSYNFIPVFIMKLSEHKYRISSTNIK